MGTRGLTSLLRRCGWQRQLGVQASTTAIPRNCRLPAPISRQGIAFEGRQRMGGSLHPVVSSHGILLQCGPVRCHSSSSGSNPAGGAGKGGGNHYTQIGGPIDRKVCALSEAEINNLLSARIQCKRARDFQRADQIQGELRRSGVFVNDKSKEWRADGQSFFHRNTPSEDANKMPRMRDCQTMDEAIQVLSDNLAKASNRDISAFWAVVPTLLRKRGSGNRHQSQQLVSQLSSIFNKTAEKIGTYGPQDLATTTLAFAKIVDILEKRGGGPYHDCLRVILVDRKETIFQFIAKTSMPILSQFDARCLANLAYAYGLIGYLPEFDDGSTLFHHIAEKSIPLFGKFKPQGLSNTVWAFDKVGASHPALFEKVGDHIVALRSLDEFNSQDISNLLNAFAKAGVSHTALFERVGDHIVALRSLDAFNSQDIANTLNAFAKAGGSHPCLFERLGDHIVALGSLDEFAPQALANTVNAFAKTGASHPPLFEKVADHIVALGSLDAFSPQSIANTVNAFGKAGVLNAFAKAEVSHPALFEKVGDHIVALKDLDAFNSQDIANTLNAFAKAGISHQSLFEKVADHIVALRSLDAFSPQSIANTVNAFGKAGVPHPALFERVGDHIVALGSLDAFNSQDIANTVHAFADVGVSHPSLFEKMADHIVALGSLDDWSEQDISNVAWAYQKAGIVNISLSDQLTIAAVEKSDEFEDRTIKNFLHWTDTESSPQTQH